MGFPLKDKRGIKITNAFQNILDGSKSEERKPNEIRLDKRSEFYNRSVKSWLIHGDNKMYSTHNEGKSVILERFIRTFKNKICKYMTSVSKNVYIDKLDDIVKEYNNSYHRTIKMKPANVKSSTYIDSGKENNEKDSKFRIGYQVRIPKYRSIFAKS